MIPGEEQTNWRDMLDERQRKEIEFAKVYVGQFGHGTTGHNQLVLIATLAEMLDTATRNTGGLLK